jgi:hypothetical protein
MKRTQRMERGENRPVPMRGDPATERPTGPSRDVPGGRAAVHYPLATVVSGGLVSSTLVTLVALPTVYLRLERRPPANA